MRWVFDLDGTLIETRPAHLAAYRSIGCEPPENFHLRPWQTWCGEREHELKNEALPKLLAELSHELPAANILRAMGGTILTNASRASYDAILSVFPFLAQYSADTHIEMVPQDKVLWLQKNQGRVGCPGFYLDDSSNLVSQVRRETRWQALDMSGS